MASPGSGLRTPVATVAIAPTTTAGDHLNELLAARLAAVRAPAIKSDVVLAPVTDDLARRIVAESVEPSNLGRKIRLRSQLTRSRAQRSPARPDRGGSSLRSLRGRSQENRVFRRLDELVAIACTCEREQHRSVETDDPDSQEERGVGSVALRDGHQEYQRGWHLSAAKVSVNRGKRVPGDNDPRQRRYRELGEAQEPAAGRYGERCNEEHDDERAVRETVRASARMTAITADPTIATAEEERRFVARTYTWRTCLAMLRPAPSKATAGRSEDRRCDCSRGGLHCDGLGAHCREGATREPR